MNNGTFNWRWLAIAAVAIAAVWLFSQPQMKNVVELINGTIWPITLLIAVWWFRDDLIALAQRITKIGKDGAEFEPPQPLPPPGSDPTAPLGLPAPSPAGSARAPVGNNTSTGALDKPSIQTTIAPVYRPLVDHLLTQTAERIALLQRTFSESENDIAVGIAADASAALFLERASRYIYESQLEALDELKWIKTTKEQFRPFYDKASQSHPNFYQNYSFDQWFNFLVLIGLIEGRDDEIRVTAAGEALKMYMAQQKYFPVAA